MAKTAKRGRPPKLKQTYIDGTAPGGIVELDGAADTYYDAMTTDGLVVRVVDHSNVKCKRKNAEENGDGDE